MKLNLTKSQIGQKEVRFLGFTISDGITASKSYLETVQDMTKPQTINEMQKCLGKLGYIRNHIPGYSRVAKHCYKGITRREDQREMSHKQFGREPLILKDKMVTAWEELKPWQQKHKLMNQETQTCPYGFFIKLEGEDVDRDGYLWVSNEGSERTVKCYSKQLKGPVMKYSSEGAKMALLELYWNKLVALAQGQLIIIKDNELNNLWAANNTEKMLSVTTTWDKWRNVVGTKGVRFIADQEGEQEDEPPKPERKRHKVPKEKPRDIVVFTDGSKKAEKNRWVYSKK